MKRQLGKYRNPLSIGVVLAFACLFLLVSRAGSSSTSFSVQREDLPIDNKTQAFQVIGSEINNGVISLSLKNGYSKAINGFTIGGSETSGVQVDFTSTDSTIAPGEIYQYKIPIQSIQSSFGGAPNDKLNLKILSVLFEDGTNRPKVCDDLRAVLL